MLGGIMLAGLTSGCLARPPAELTPTEILTKASDALKKVSSVHFKLTSTGGMMAIGTGLVARSIEGDVVRPDRLKGTAVSTFGKLTVDLGFMIVGTHQYITNPMTRKWEEIPSPATAPNLLDPDRGAPALLKQITQLKKLASDTVDGVDCYHVSGAIAASLIAGLVGAPGTSNALAGDVWVGTKDFLVRQIRLVGPISSNEPPQIQRVLALSKYNETVSIEPPT
jgi:hypothetical protein